MSREEEDELSSQQLGTLPETLLEERGGIPRSRPDGYDNRRRAAPGDIAYQQSVQALVRGAPIGSSSQKTLVTTTFDARPINARDFVVSEKVEFTAQNPGVLIPADLTFQVPDGYIAILRGFKWSFRAQTISDMLINGNEQRLLFTPSVLVDNATQPNYDDIGEIGIWMNNLFPCYILANSLQIITLRLQPAIGPDGNDTNITDKIKMTMQGNLLLAKALPLQYEPGSV